MLSFLHNKNKSASKRISARRPSSHRNRTITKKVAAEAADALALTRTLASISNSEEVKGILVGLRELAADINDFPQFIGQICQLGTQAEVLKLIEQLLYFIIDPYKKHFSTSGAEALEKVAQALDTETFLKLPTTLASNENYAKIKPYIFIMLSGTASINLLAQPVSALNVSDEIVIPLAQASWQIAKARALKEGKQNFVSEVANLILDHGVDYCLSSLTGQILIRPLFADPNMPAEQKDKIAQHIMDHATDTLADEKNYDAILWQLRCDWFDENKQEAFTIAAEISQCFANPKLNYINAAPMFKRIWAFYDKPFQMAGFFQLTNRLSSPEGREVLIMLAHLYEHLAGNQKSLVLDAIKGPLITSLESNQILACEKLSALTIIAENASGSTVDDLFHIASTLFLDLEGSDNESSDDEENENSITLDSDDDDPDEDAETDSKLPNIEAAQLQLVSLHLLRAIFSKLLPDQKQKFFDFLINSLTYATSMAEKYVLMEMLTPNLQYLAAEQKSEIDIAVKQFSHPFVKMAMPIIIEYVTSSKQARETISASSSDVNTLKRIGVHANNEKSDIAKENKCVIS